MIDHTDVMRPVRARVAPARRRDDARDDPRAGFTLVEILVVVAIIGLLLVTVAPAAMQQFGKAKVRIASSRSPGSPACSISTGSTSAITRPRSRDSRPCSSAPPGRRTGPVLHPGSARPDRPLGRALPVPLSEPAARQALRPLQPWRQRLAGGEGRDRELMRCSAWAWTINAFSGAHLQPPACGRNQSYC